jgi:hypothetical protein
MVEKSEAKGRLLHGQEVTSGTTDRPTDMEAAGVPSSIVPKSRT